MTIAGWDNAIYATEPSPFFDDLGRAVGNGDNDHAAAVRYWLHTLGADENPWHAWDFGICSVERVGRAWGVMRLAADMFGAQEVLPRVARFVCDRWVTAMQSAAWPDSEVTRAVVLAERAHDLVGLMQAGVKVTGSGDQYALRRAAKHWLIAAVMP